MNRIHITIFNQWLDAVVGGRSTSPTTTSDATMQEVTSAARQLHDLARKADAAPPHRSLPPTWEEFMHAHRLDASPPVTSNLTGSIPGSAPRTASGKVFAAANARPVRLASNILLAAIILAVLLAGAWRAADTFRPAPPEEPSTIPFGGFIQDDATPAAGTEVDLLAPATADQCTIAPLTVDEVVAIVRDPWAATTGQESSASTPLSDTPATLDDLYVATPDIDPEAARPDEFATDEELAGVTATFHMFEACIAANSYFQMWATMAPTLVQQSILAVLPPLTGEDDLRALLTDLEANGPGNPIDSDTIFLPPTMSIAGGYSIAAEDSPTTIFRVARIVDQDLQNTWMPEPHYVVTGYTTHQPDGTETETFRTSIYDADFDGIPDPVIGYDPRLTWPSCFTIIFMWNDLRDMWLIQQYPVCG